MRCYNGCPDSELKAVWDNLESVEKELHKINPNAFCVYFPMEQVHQVWLNNKPIGIESTNKITALRSAISNLQD